MPPVIDSEKCIGCGTCADICPTQVYRRVPGVRVPDVLFGEECWHCNSCVLDCPRQAIRLRMPLTHRLLYVDASSLRPGAEQGGDEGKTAARPDRRGFSAETPGTKGETSC